MRNAMPMAGGPKKPVAAHGVVALLPAPVTQSAPVTALAYSPDGTLLAAGGYRSVRLLEPATGKVLHTLAGPVDQVLSVAWSPDGKRLAAAGGLASSTGEVCVWDVPAAGAAWDKPRVLRDHTDTIFAVAWRPGTGEFATASNDKTAKVWDLAAGKATRTLKDHVDVVSAVAYSPDGKWLATGSADRTIKLYQTDTGAKAASLSHGEGVTAVAFSAKSDLVVSATQDKRVSVWPVRTGSIENPVRGHGEGEAVTAVAFSSQGDTFVWGASNRKVRIWNGEVSQHRREMNDAPDWVYSVAASPDGKQVAAGCGDGKVYFWTANDGKLERSVPLGGPNPVPAVTAAEAKR
jgi:WD40 repeat protein